MPAKKKPAKKTAAQTNPVAELKQKLARIQEIRKELAKVKALYQEHDVLLTQVLPMFIDVQDDKFIIARSISLGGKKYDLVPYFYDPEKGTLVGKQWKSTAMNTVTIDAA